MPMYKNLNSCRTDITYCIQEKCFNYAILSIYLWDSIFKLFRFLSHTISRRVLCPFLLEWLREFISILNVCDLYSHLLSKMASIPLWYLYTGFIYKESSYLLSAFICLDKAENLLCLLLKIDIPHIHIDPSSQNCTCSKLTFIFLKHRWPELYLVLQMKIWQHFIKWHKCFPVSTKIFQYSP